VNPTPRAELCEAIHHGNERCWRSQSGETGVRHQTQMTDSEDEETADGTEAEDETTTQDADAVLGSSDTDYLETAKMGSSDTRHETVDQVTQEAVLERDQHRCRACGVKGPGAGGLADLEVHHADRDPDDIEEHHMSNLLTLCRSCHSWHHKRAQPSESPIRLTDADLSELLSHDIEILRILDEHGPLRTGAIEEALSVDMTVTAVRERLWLLAGLDNHVDDRAEPPVMKDVASQEWGLIGDIVTTARGHIPDDPKHLVQRVEDELMRRAFDRGCDRETIMEVFDSSRRGTFYKEKRAKMYDFPLDAFSRGGRPRLSETSADESVSSARGPDEAEAIRNAAARASEATADSGGESAGEIVSDAGEIGGDSENKETAADANETDAVQQLLEEALDAMRDDTSEQ